MAKNMGASSTNKVKRAPKVPSAGKGQASKTMNKGSISGAGLPAPKVSSVRGVKGDERA